VTAAPRPAAADLSRLRPGWLEAKRLGDLLDALASVAPAPAGGAAAALAGALGAALAGMVCRVAEAADPGRPPLRRLRSEADRLRRRLARLAAADAMAYARVVSTRRRRPPAPAAVERALQAATEIPLAVLETARDALELFRSLAPRARPSTASDLAVGVHLAWAAAHSGAVTARANLDDLPASPAATALDRRLRRGLLEAEALHRELVSRLADRPAPGRGAPGGAPGAAGAAASPTAGP